MTCPTCSGTDWKMASVVYAAGISHVSTSTTGIGIATNGNIGVGRAKTSGVYQTDMSIKAAPPKEVKDPVGNVIAGCAFFLFSLIMLFFTPVLAIIMLFFSAIALVCVLVGYSKDVDKYKEYRAELDRWGRMRVCSRCGSMYVPIPVANGVISEVASMGAATRSRGLTDDQRSHIRALRDAGKSQAAIADELGVTIYAVRNALGKNITKK